MFSKKEKKKNEFSSRHVKTYRRTSIPSHTRRGSSFFSKNKGNRHRKNSHASVKQDAFLHYGYYFLLILFFGALVYILLFSPYVKIVHIDLHGTEDIPTEDILMYTDEYLSDPYLYIFPRRSYTLFQEGSYEQYMKELFPKIRTLDVKKAFPNTIQLNIVERTALMVWCSGGVCYMLDEFGHAYEREEDISYAPTLKRVRIVDMSGQEVYMGAKVIHEELLDLFVQFYGGFERITGYPLEEKFEMKGNIAQETQATTIEGWTIKLSTNITAERSLRMLKTFLEKEFKTMEEREKLEYIDVRVENKVFYKLKDEYIEVNEDEDNGEDNSDEDVASIKYLLET